VGFFGGALPLLVLADGVGVEEGLGGVRVGAVAGVDDAGVDAAGEEVGGAGLAVAQDDDVGAVGGEVAGGVEEGLAFDDAAA